MDKSYEMPGLRLVGMVCTGGVNDDVPIPLFEPQEPADRPSINTLEGWNRLAAEINARYPEEDLSRLIAAEKAHQTVSNQQTSA